MGRSRCARGRIVAPRRLETGLQPRNRPGIGHQDGWGRREARAAKPGPEGGRKWCSCHATGLERVIHRGGAVVALAVSGWGPSAAETALVPRNRPGTGRQEGGRVSRHARCLAGAPRRSKMELLATQPACNCPPGGGQGHASRGLPGRGPWACENGASATQPAWSRPAGEGGGDASRGLPGRAPWAF